MDPVDSFGKRDFVFDHTAQDRAKVKLIKKENKEILKNNGSHAKRNIFKVAGAVLTIGVALLITAAATAGVVGALTITAVVLPPLAVVALTVGAAIAAGAGALAITAGVVTTLAGIILAIVHHVKKNARIQEQKTLAYSSLNPEEQHYMVYIADQYYLGKPMTYGEKIHYEKLLNKYGFTSHIDQVFDNLSEERKDEIRHMSAKYAQDLVEPCLSENERNYYLHTLNKYGS